MRRVWDRLLGERVWERLLGEMGRGEVTGEKTNCNQKFLSTDYRNQNWDEKIVIS